MHVPFQYECFLLLSDCSGSPLGLYFYSVLMEESSEGWWEMVSQVDQCPAPSLNRKVRKNYPPHLFVWQLINICFDRFSCRYIFNPISKDWPFVRCGQLDAGPASLSFTKGKTVINQSQHSIYPLLYMITISRLHAKSTDNLLSP